MIKLQMRIFSCNRLFSITITFKSMYKQQKMEMKTSKHIQKHVQTTPQEQKNLLFLGDTQMGQKINEVLNSGAYAIFSTCIMIFTLFADDIRQICFPNTADLTFSVLALICMIIYAIEIVLFSLVQKNYFLKYYFWLDLVSTLTISFDLVWITQFITGGGKSAANVFQITRASRAARLGTRTVRLIKLIRMIRILRQVKALNQDLAAKTKIEAPERSCQRLSKRLSSIHSRLASNRHMNRIQSLKIQQKKSSKRWSLIKDVNCVNIQGGSMKNVTSLNCLPMREADQVVQSSQSSEQSSKMQSIKIVNSATNMLAGKSLEQKPRGVVILQRIEEEEPAQAPIKTSKEVKRMNKMRTRFDANSGNNLEPSAEEINIPAESKVGSMVEQEIQKNIILLIILILISIPLMDASTWFATKTVYQKSIQQLMYFAQNLPSQYPSQATSYIQQATNFKYPLLYFSIQTASVSDSFPDNYAYHSENINDILFKYRNEDIDVYEGNGYKVAFNIYQQNKFTSIFNIARTFFISLLLIFTTMVFSSDLEHAAITPLQDMFDTVRKIAVHPLGALKQIEQRNMCMEAIDKQNQNIEITEPKILQNTIVKIGSLLAVGFGQAGAEIISKVIEDPSIMNVVIPGQKIMAIFGFCDIRNFTDATEVLEADVMVFVNQIASICHKVVYEHMGSPNKNIGDAFLLVWKISQEDCKITQTGQQLKIDIVPKPRVRQQADLAVLALIKIISESVKAEKLQKYKNNKGLQSRIPNYMGVKMGFGLHVGWAIEGPIGSEYKIDASYLSHHVNMASRLQAGTKGYGCNMLITGDVYDLMTENKRFLRQVDRVMPSGDTEIHDLYTVDMDPKHLFNTVGVKAQMKMNDKEKRMAKVKQNINRKQLWEDLNTQSTTDAMWMDEDIAIMRQKYKTQFYQEWKKAFKSYEQGRWEEALSELNAANALAPGGSDGPSEALIKFIESHHGKAPADWEGYRSFD